MKDLRDLKDLIIHDVQPATNTETTLPPESEPWSAKSRASGERIPCRMARVVTSLYTVSEQPPLLNYDGLQPGSAVGSRLQQDPICSFVKAWVWQ